jgi:hypothetical protein
MLLENMREHRVANQSTEIPLLNQNSTLKRIRDAILNDQEKLLSSNFITRFLGKE